MKLKDLTVTIIKQFAGPTIYSRGDGYYKSGMIYEFNYDQASDSIHAGVSGNYGDYDVDISAGTAGVDAACDCPYDGYPCKHVVAVLLMFVHERDQQVKKSAKQKKEAMSLKDQIGKLPKPELVNMIITCADKYPDFKRELMVRFEPDNSITLETILKQIERAFPSIESGSYSTASVARQLKAITRSVEQASDAVRAEILWAVSDRILQELNNYGMDDQSLENVLVRSCDALIECVAGNDSLAERKQEIIDQLWIIIPVAIVGWSIIFMIR